MTTRTSILIAVAAIFLFAAPARAEDADSAFPVVVALDAKLQSLPDSWKERWAAYQDVKADLGTERKSLAPSQDLWWLRKAWNKREAGKEELTSWEKRRAEQWDALSETERAPVVLWEAFIPVQTRVAAALRRDQLSLLEILMGFFAATLLWGGFAVTVTIAMRSEKAKKEAQTA